MSTPSESDRRAEFLGRLEREERRQDDAQRERDAEDAPASELGSWRTPPRRRSRIYGR